MKLQILLASAGLVALAACGGATDPSGDLEIVGDPGEISVGQTVNLRWTAKNTNRVYLTLEVDGREPMMIDPAGYQATGSREFEVDPTAFSFVNDDDITVTFKLKARDDDGDDFETLDEETIEVNAPGAN